MLRVESTTMKPYVLFQKVLSINHAKPSELEQQALKLSLHFSLDGGGRPAQGLKCNTKTAKTYIKGI